jgi:ribosomal-protein-alanine N-acetyltransferase
MIADVAIRLATPADAIAIAEMSREYIEQGLPWRWTPARVRRNIFDPNTNTVVVEEQGVVVAFGIMFYAEEDAHLLLLAVRGGRQRGGVGSAILLWLENAARAAGAKRIRVEARSDNLAARNFYNEHGYHERTIKPGMYSAIASGVCMEKWLRGDTPVDDASE